MVKTMNNSNKSYILSLLVLTLLFISENCTTPHKTERKEHYSSKNLIIKEFSPLTKKWLPIIVIYDAVLLNEKALFRREIENEEKGIISYLTKSGFTVYLLSSKNDKNNFKEEAGELDSILNQIADKQSNRSFILGGVSLGGQMILEYMKLPTNFTNLSKIKKIFFIGTGIDYNYTNSFLEKSKNSGYENQFVKDLCNRDSADNFCNRYIRFNNQLQKQDNSKKEEFFHRIPKLEKANIENFHPTKLHLPYFFLYGKLDSISPEESIYPLFHKINPKGLNGNSQNKYYEAGEANGHSIDYDHADLFLYENAETEIYPELIRWLKK